MVSAIPEILLVDDCKIDRDLFELALLSGNHHAHLTFACDGPDAILKLDRSGIYGGASLPELIVLDIGLPGVKGLTLLEILRRNYTQKQLPIVVMTNSRRESDLRDCAALGINAYIEKPTSFDQLKQEIAKMCQFLPAETIALA